MILASLEIENYKQYVGCHEIDFPEQGMVAITGPNGAGKTTLFEAIEWCLYGPRSIALATIPPHGGVGRTRVRVTLQGPDGRRHVIQRVLRNGLTSAEAYDEDNPGQPVVQGPRDVTEHVARTLIGLPHAAFVSTFFTRQKELTFFGDRSETERRVEVARLLGFQTIRDAQEDIGQERQSARQTAVSLKAQYDRDSMGRDFADEISQADVAVSAAQAAAAASLEHLAAADAAFAAARDELERWRALQEQDAEHEKVLLTIAGKVQVATSQRQSADTQLARLLALHEERVALEPRAAAIAELVDVAAAMETERERARRLESVQQKRHEYAGQLTAAARSVGQIVGAHREAAFELDGWFWAEGDDDDPCRATSRLSEAIATLDQPGIRQRAEFLRKAFDLSTRIGETAKNLDHYRAFRDKLSRERDAHTAGGDPKTRLDAAEVGLSSAQSALEQALAKLTEARREHEESEELERIFDERTFNRRCPTCTRPLSDDEAAKLLRTLHGSTQRLKDDELACAREVEQARANVGSAESERSSASDALQKIGSLQERLADGERMISELEAEHSRNRADLAVTLTVAGMDTPPCQPEIEAAQTALERATQLAAVAGTLDQLGQRAAVARDGMIEADADVLTLGTVTYDAGAHRSALSDLDTARHAAAEIKRIDIELRAQDQYLSSRDTAAGELAELEERTREVEAARAAIGFDSGALRQARTLEDEAAAEQRQAREEAAQSRELLRDAQITRERIVDEQNRLRQLAEEADRLGREADELDRMYREFAEFDKFVADHVGPLLADTTERLLSLVTHGKYDRVRFDESYGIELFDGDECFKLEGFSGGERDVVALCARLAMSELVGSAAHRPPRFLVLDEVFGSLDNERRAQLLETLGLLASGGHFQQMFIISHVDDVQQSPVMNEAWTIEERSGVSHLVRPELVTAASA